MADKPDNIRFNALRNAIYHTSRRGFFDLLNRSLSFLVVLTGSAAFGNLVLGWLDAKVFVALATLAGLSQLVFGFGERARTHEFLQRRFYELAANIAECKEPTDDDCLRWEATLNRLYAEEPPPMRALDAISYNAALDSLGRNKQGRIPVKPSESLFRHVWPYNEKSF